MIINLVEHQTKALPNEILDRIRSYIPVSQNDANVIVLSVLQVLSEHDIECEIEAPE